ncbi:YceI family protein [Stappia sp. MMSF_3263]|uniref:YceI family protein n=1 Tax=Stappia sp. MMSF_3263 TaxID=3046693 RepID=UPI00273D25DB|nr:YceI family protein [Stappia sp. MMSF_3263]
MFRTSAAALAALLVAAPAIAEPVAYDFDKSHASLVFSYNHLGYSTTDGRFNDWNGELVIDQETPANSKIAMTVNVDSLATFWGERDAHFKSADFFEVEAHPTATFVSTTVEKTGENTLSVAGELTIKGITKPATFDVTINTIGEHPMAKTPAVGLDAKTVVKRSDYGMDMFVPYVGDEVTISFSAEALKAK